METIQNNFPIFLELTNPKKCPNLKDTVLPFDVLEKIWFEYVDANKLSYSYLVGNGYFSAVIYKLNTLKTKFSFRNALICVVTTETPRKLELMQLLLKTYGKEMLDESMKSMYLVDLDILKFCHHNHLVSVFDISTMHYAASEGNFATVKWLNENRSEGCYENVQDFGSTLDMVVRSGHFEIFEYLVKNYFRKEKLCLSKFAFETCQKPQYLEYIKKHRREEYYSISWINSAILVAARLDNVEMLEYLFNELDTDNELLHERFEMSVADAACEKGNIETMNWLLRNRPEQQFTVFSLSHAIFLRNAEIVKWLIQNQPLLRIHDLPENSIYGKFYKECLLEVIVKL